MKTLHFLGSLAAFVLVACSIPEAQGSNAEVGSVNRARATARVVVDVASSLDGMTFITDFREKGAAESTLDTVSFNKGTCYSTMCDAFGFSKGSYSIASFGEEIVFTATTYSESEGEMVWNGTVVGNTIDGTVVWNKEGQDRITYLFDGSTR